MATRIFFATNRNQTGKISGVSSFGTRFNSDGPHFYRVGSADVARSGSGKDARYTVKDVSVARESKSGAPRLIGSASVFAELRAAMAAASRDIIIYIHGFANSFENTLINAAQLADAYKIKRRPDDPLAGDDPEYSPYVFVFSWPSNGSVTPPWHYFSDRDDAEASGTAMARALRRLLDFLSEMESDLDKARRATAQATTAAKTSGTAPEGAHDLGQPCRQRMHLVAHSMGNWALRHTLRKLRGQGSATRLRPIFENAFLMAADEDDDALAHQHKLASLTEISRRVHVYHSSDDGALVVSDTTKFNPDRLGYYGPKTFSGLNTRIQAIDCSGVDATEFLDVNHQYYRLRPEVIQDVQAVLSGQVRPDSFPWRQVVEPGRRYRIGAG